MVVRSSRRSYDPGMSVRSGATKRYLEDVVVGEQLRSSDVQIDRDAMIRFAESFDPQPMHLTEAAGEASMFGRLIASGWYTLSLTMRLMVDAKPFGQTPLVGVELKDIRFTSPVVAGMIVHAESTVTDVRASTSRPDRGYVSMDVLTMTDQNTEVARRRWVVLVPARSTAGS